MHCQSQLSLQLMKITFGALSLITCLALPSGVIGAPLLTATCGKLSGAKVTLEAGRPVTSSDSHSGNPILYVDSDNPRRLVTHWKSPISDKGPVSSYEAVVIELSETHLRAVERDFNGTYMYTLFLKTGELFYSHHREQSLVSAEASLLSFAGKCAVESKR